MTRQVIVRVFDSVAEREAGTVESGRSLGSPQTDADRLYELLTQGNCQSMCGCRAFFTEGGVRLAHQHEALQYLGGVS